MLLVWKLTSSLRVYKKTKLFPEVSMFMVTFLTWWLTQNFVPFSYLCSLWGTHLLFDSSWGPAPSEIPMQFHFCSMQGQWHRLKRNQAVSISGWVMMMQKILCTFPFYIHWSRARMFTGTHSLQSWWVSSLLATCPTLISFRISSQRTVQNLQYCLVFCWPREHSINI